MTITLGNLFNSVDAFILIFIRMTGLFVVAPIFGRRNIPTYYKVGFSFLLAMVMLNTIKIPQLPYDNDFYQYSILVFKEFMVGLILGYVSYIYFTAIYVAGQLIDMQVGFGMVSVLDPVSNIQVPITANFYFILSMLFFLTLNGHHQLINALFQSYSYVPLGTAVFSGELLVDIIRISASTLWLGFKIAAPVTAAILLTDVALGVICKAVPQMNVFVVGMPLKIFIGLVVILFTLQLFSSFIGMIMNAVDSEMMNFMKNMGPVR